MSSTLKKLSKEEKAIWKSLSSRIMVTTKFFEVDTLQDLGMLDLTLAMLTEAGLSGFIGRSAPSFADLTLEFLSTFEREGDLIKFRLFDKRYKLTKEELMEVFGVTKGPREDLTVLAKSEVNFQVWSHIIGSATFRGKQGEYIYSITHPCLRLCHRVLVVVFFGQGEVNKMNRLNLAMLWSLLPDCPVVPDWVELFLGSVVRIRKATSGRICIGGMVMLIALRFLSLDDIKKAYKKPDGGGYLYDFQLLRTSSCLGTLPDGSYVWKWNSPAVNYLRLPCPLPSGARAQDFYCASNLAPAAEEEAAEEPMEPAAPVHEPMAAGDVDAEPLVVYSPGDWDDRFSAYQSHYYSEPTGWTGAEPSSSTPDPWHPELSFEQRVLGELQSLSIHQGHVEDTLDSIAEHQRLVSAFWQTQWPGYPSYPPPDQQ